MVPWKLKKLCLHDPLAREPRIHKDYQTENTLPHTNTLVPSCISWTPVAQNYSHTPKFMDYVIRNATPEAQFGLMKSCKALAIKFPSAVCHKLVYAEYDETTEYYQQSLTIKQSEISNIKDVKLRISNYFQSTGYKSMLKDILPKIYQCDARYIFIITQQLPFNELKLLLNPNRVLELTIKWSKFQKDDKSYASIDEIFELIPNATSVE